MKEVVCDLCGQVDKHGLASRVRGTDRFHCYWCRFDATIKADFGPLFPDGMDTMPAHVEPSNTGGWCMALFCGWRMVTLEDDAPMTWVVCDYEDTGWGYEGEPVLIYEGGNPADALTSLLGNPSPEGTKAYYGRS